MPISPDPMSPTGTSIPLQKPDVERLLKGNRPDAVASKAYGLDPGFRKAFDHYSAMPDLDATTKSRLPELVLNRYYFGAWEREPVDDLTAAMSQPPDPTIEQGFLSRIRGAAQDRFTGALEAGERFQQGQQSFPETALQVAGKAAGFVGDAAADTLMTGASKVTPDFIEEPLKNAGIAILQTPVGQAGIKALQGGMEMYEGWKQQNPRAAENLEAVVNVSSLLPIGKATQIAGKGAVKGAEAGAKAVSAMKLPPEAMRGVRESLLKRNARWANVPEEDIMLAYQHPERMEQAMKAVEDNPEASYSPLAREAGGKLLKFEKDAQVGFQQASESFVKTNPRATFDVSQSIPDLRAILKKEFNIGLDDASKKVEQKPIETGILNDQGAMILKDPPKAKNAPYRLDVVPGPANKFTSTEITALDELVNTIANAKQFKAPDLLDMEKTFDKAYNAVRLTELKTPKEYHAMIMRLKDGFDIAMRGGEVVPGQPMSGILPADLKEAYAQLANAKGLLREFGGNLIQGEGKLRRVSDNAEGFVKSLSHDNKDVRRQRIQRLEQILGIDLSDSVDFISAAKRLSRVEPVTAGRQGDIIRSAIIPSITGIIGAGAGAMVGGLPGGFAGQAAGATAGVVINRQLSSPAKAAERAIKAGKKAKKQ